MNRLLSGIAAIGMMFGAQALAVERSQSIVNQRQIKGCMIKRMSVDKTVAYNDAKKACADQLRAQNNGPGRPLTAASRPGS